MKLQVNQCVIDACLQCEGTEDALFDFADMNKTGITEILSAGTELVGLQRHKGLKEKSATTALTRRPPGSRPESEGEGEGIEFWRIELDFVVS